jgi:hypothetical protein
MVSLADVRGLVVLVLACLLGAGCADTTYYTPLVTPSRPLVPKPAEAVAVLTATPPGRAFQIVGTLQVIEGGGQDFEINRMLEELRGQAAAVGCDAVLITLVDRRSNRYTESSVQGSCVVYPQPAAPASAAAPKAPEAVAAIVIAGPVAVRTAPFAVAPVQATLPAGFPLSAAPAAVNGWRFVTMPDGRAGYIPDGAVRAQ